LFPPGGARGGGGAVREAATRQGNVVPVDDEPLDSTFGDEPSDDALPAYPTPAATEGSARVI